MGIDLQKFCATNPDPRQHLYQPWSHMGWTYATNGHIVVRILDPESEGKVSDNKSASRAAEMFSAAPAAGHGPLPSFKQGERCAWCDGRGYFYTNDCPECEGGEFTHGSHNYPCAECDGTGELKASASTGTKSKCGSCNGHRHDSLRVNVGKSGAQFDANYLAWIRELPGVEIAARGPEDSAHFRFIGGEGLLMPMRPA